MVFVNFYLRYDTFLMILIIIRILSCQNLKIGAAINIFERFGYLSISMRVVPRNDSDNTWIFREPTADIFENVEYIKNITIKNSDNNIFHGDFDMAFCDGLQELFRVYFQDFIVERLDKPWVAFTESWSNETIAYKMGINVSYVNNDNCYVLVRLSRIREIISMAKYFPNDNSTLHEGVSAKSHEVSVGNVTSVRDFVKNFGSHYITSYATGNAMYQVIVYTPSVFNQLKSRLRESGIPSLTISELNSLFSPQYAEHLGIVLTSSGNLTLLEWAKNTLITSQLVNNNSQPYLETYMSLLKLYKNARLLRELEGLLGNEALLKLHLQSLGPVFKDEKTRDWFLEILDNTLKLWEIN